MRHFGFGTLALRDEGLVICIYIIFIYKIVAIFFELNKKYRKQSRQVLALVVIEVIVQLFWFKKGVGNILKKGYCFCFA